MTTQGYFQFKKWTKQESSLIKGFLKKIEQHIQVLCLVGEHTKNSLHITTFVNSIEEIEDKIYTAEYEVMETFKKTPVDWHLRESQLKIEGLKPHEGTVAIWYRGIPGIPDSKSN